MAGEGEDDADDVGGKLADCCEGGRYLCWSVTCARGRDESLYAQAIKKDIAGTCPGLGEVLAKWDDAHDTKRFAICVLQMYS